MPARPLFATTDDYIAACPPEVQLLLKKVRAAIRKAAPDAEERISYRMPAFFQGGVVVFFAAFKNHIGLYPPVRGDEALVRDLAPYRGEKGNLKFPLDRPIPYDLIRRVVKCRLRDNETRPKSARKAKR